MSNLGIYLVERTDVAGYDEHRGFVIVAKSPKEALKFTPASPGEWNYSTWTAPENVSVVRIGTANSKQRAGIVLESFNAG